MNRSRSHSFVKPFAVLAATVFATLAGCARDRAPAADASPEALEPWPARHLQRRALAILDVGRRAASARDAARSAPRAIARVPGSPRLVGLVAGADEVVLLSDRGEVLARAPSPPRPTDLAFAPSGTLLASSAASGAVARYRLVVDDEGEPTLDRLDDLVVSGASSIAAIASAGRRGGASWLFAADRARQRVYATREDRTQGSQELGRCEQPVSLVATRDYLVAACGRAGISVWGLAADDSLGAEPIARATDRGPVWTVAAEARWDPRESRRHGLLLAGGGVARAPGHEGAALGSYAFVYALEPGGELERLASVEVSRHGVVNPVWVGLAQGVDGSIRVDVLGFSGARRAALTWPGGEFSAEPAIETRAALPGSSDAAPSPPGLAAASSLLGGWVFDRPAPKLVPAAAGRAPLERVGAALAWTTLLADPAGPPGRAACVACHSERRDGEGGEPADRVWPRASDLDPEALGELAMAAFARANSDPGRDPWFAIERDAHPWLAHISGLPARLSPVFLRHALASYLGDFDPASHPLMPVTGGP